MNRRQVGVRNTAFCMLILLGIFSVPCVGGQNVWTTSGPYGWNDPIAVDPTDSSRLYGIGASGYWISEDGGYSWAAWEKDILGIPLLLIDPSDPKVLYTISDTGGAYSSEEIYKSTDGGTHWFSASEGIRRAQYGRIHATALAMDPALPQTLYAGTQDYGIYKTLNGGQSWSPSHEGFPGTDSNITIGHIAVDPRYPSTLYAAIAGSSWAGRLLKSVDGGATWLFVPDNRAWGIIYQIVFDSFLPETLLMNTSEGMYKTLDGGASWRRLTLGLPESGLVSLMADPLRPGFFYVSSEGGPSFRSRDGGETWDPMGPRESTCGVWNHLASASAPAQLWAWGNGPLYRSPDGGGSWVEMPDAAHGRSIQSLAASPWGTPDLFADRGDSFFSSPDGGASWRDGGGCASKDGLWRSEPLVPDPWNQGTLYTGGNTVWKSEDMGRTWNTVGDPSWDIYLRTTALVADPNHRSTLYTALWDGYLGESPLLRSPDGGLSWTPASGNLPRALGIISLVIDPRNSRTLYASTTEGLFKTTDGGGVWEALHGGLPARKLLNSLVLAASNPDVLYGSAWWLSEDLDAYDEVYRSLDGGASWVKVSPASDELPMQRFLLGVDPQRAETVYARNEENGETFLLVSSDGGVTWASAGDGLPPYFGTSIVFDPSDSRNLHVGSSGVYSIFRCDPPTVIKVRQRSSPFRLIVATSMDLTPGWKVFVAGQTQPWPLIKEISPREFVIQSAGGLFPKDGSETEVRIVNGDGCAFTLAYNRKAKTWRPLPEK